MDSYHHQVLQMNGPKKGNPKKGKKNGNKLVWAAGWK
jgi:hypothetical protein